MKPITAIVWNDTHTNSTIALNPPSSEHDDGNSHVLGKAQMWLHQCWLDFQEKAKAAAKGTTVYGFLNGDGVDVDEKDRSNQFITRNHVDAVEMAREINQPMVDLCDYFFLIRGTGAHEGRSSEYAKLLAKQLKANTYEGQQAPWYWIGELSGVKIEAAHHAVGGFRRASAGAGSVTRLAEETVLEYSESGERVPNLVLRGHVHRFADSYDNVEGCRAITNGAWQIATDHVHRLALGTRLSHIGGLIIRCEAGRYEVTKIRYKPIRSRTYRDNR